MKIVKSTLFFYFAIICCLRPNAQIIDAFKNAVYKSADKQMCKSLNGQWKFHLVKGDDWSNYEKFYETNYDDKEWGSIPVPGCWDALGYVSPKYANPDNMNGLYRTDFVLPHNWKGQQVFLQFDGVLRGYELWVNGNHVGKWESSYNTCNFNITPYLKPDKNILAIRNYIHYKGFDFDGNDDWGQVGINRNVSIFAVPTNRLKDLTVRTFVDNNRHARIQLKTEIFWNTFEKVSPWSLQITMIDPYGKKIYDTRQQLKNEKEATTQEQWIELTNPYLWNAETPYLYKVELTLRQGNKVIQQLHEKIGIREIKIEKDKFLLNGTPIKLRGVNLHDTDPIHGKYIHEELDLKDLKLMKEASINCVRTSHYPRTPHFYNLCDSMGIYVINEVPFGYGDKNLYDDSFKDILLTRADATVRRDKNHPCVILWSIGNENPITPIADETSKYVKKIDPTRPVCYPQVHNYFLSLDFNLPWFMDVYAPHYPTVATLRYYAEAAKRPVVLTEYCHSLGQSLEEHKELWELIEANENLAGGCVWEWVDQGMPDCKARWEGRYAWTDKIWMKDTTCITLNGNQGADGILYPNRIPLSNYYELRKNYSQAQILNKVLYGHKGTNSFKLQLNNRYDFVNLKDKVTYDWSLSCWGETIDKGSFSVDCAPRQTCKQPITLELKEYPSKALYLLHIKVRTSDGYDINEQTIRIEDEHSEKEWLYGYLNLHHNRTEAYRDFQKSELGNWIIEGPLLRTGRKFSMSEDIRVSKSAIKHYLLRPYWNKTQEEPGTIIKDCHYSNSEIAFKGTIAYTPSVDNGITIDYELKPETHSNKLLLEAGIAFLLRPELTKVHWIGYGPYATYPGKNNANNYGIHSLNAGDLYFEGNRMGVDAVACTDTEGNGLLIVCPNGNANFEETDQGIIISINTVVSGLCGKLRNTAFPVYTDDIEKLKGEVTLIPFKKETLPILISDLLKNANEKGRNENPFLSVYDTYLKRYEDIIE